jgi:hypothetical protein
MMEMPQQVDDEAAYISENFGVPFTTALKITRDAAKKSEKAKAKKTSSKRK